MEDLIVGACIWLLAIPVASGMAFLSVVALRILVRRLCGSECSWPPEGVKRISSTTFVVLFLLFACVLFVYGMGYVSMGLKVL